MSAVTAPLRRVREDAAARRRRHLRVVDEPATRHTLAYAVVMILVLGATVFGAVALNAMATAMAVEARALDAQVADAERTYAQLVADVASLEDPARIRASALELGLVPSGPARFVHVERNLPADGAVPPIVRPDATADPLKPLLSAER
ncbi:MAG: hypothetical protein JJT89_11455 [Nitriliruptoraceae bacterium]|nr:hypothetical protein [Nitriliruptoraceae bacterium]